MTVSFRPYRPGVDFDAVNALLARTYPPDDRHDNWTPARWQYMVHSVCDGDETRLADVGLWWEGEPDHSRVVAVTTHEGEPGEAYFQVGLAHLELKREMLAYAEAHLSREAAGRRTLVAYINSWDTALGALAAEAGFVQLRDKPEWTSRLVLPEVFAPVALPPGYRITDRAERDDLEAINRVLWRGFNHEGPPPEEHVASRACVERAPLYRPELHVMIEAPEGHLVSYCGTWYHPDLRMTYVEPVATDPDYRRLGLGRACVLEAVRRTHALGATRALVGSDQPFYQALGFERSHVYYPWRKEW